MKFSPQQLVMLQEALSSPMPSLSAPPQPPLLPPPPAVDSSRGEQVVLCYSHNNNNNNNCHHSHNNLSFSLAALTLLYLAEAANVAALSLAAPSHLQAGVMIGSPVLIMALLLHALALHGSAPVCQFLAVSCALSVPCVIWLDKHGPMWGLCVVLSFFFPLSTPRGLLRVGAASGTVVVLAAGPLILVPLAPRPATWGLVLVTLSVQSVVATGRLRDQRLAWCSGPGAPHSQ